MFAKELSQSVQPHSVLQSLVVCMCCLQQYNKSEESIPIEEPPIVTVEAVGGDGEEELISLDELNPNSVQAEDERDGRKDSDSSLQIPSWDGHPLVGDLSLPVSVMRYKCVS